MKPRTTLSVIVLVVGTALSAGSALAWHDETHLAVAKAAGYAKWYNATGADMAKLKAGPLEAHNHYANIPRNTTVTPVLVLGQVGRYDTIDPLGHLYGAILGAVRDYLEARTEGKYGEYPLAFAAHYLGDLSMPLHNTEYDAFNQKNHSAIDGIVNRGILENFEQIQIYPVTVRSEADLAREIARVATISRALAYRLRDEDRLPTEEEAHEQLGHSASLLRAVLEYTKAPRLRESRRGAARP